MTIVCTICARGGSKGVAGKNMRLLLGKPLLAWSVEQAKASTLFDIIAFSSDAPDLLAAARDAGADLLVQRPPELATDTAAKAPAILHCLFEAERALGRQTDLLVDLDVTSPLRSVDDIQGTVALLQETGASNVITAMPARRSPYFNLVELDGDQRVRLSKQPAGSIVRRQDAPPCYDMNASIYAWKRGVFFDRPGVFYSDTRLFVMPEERSIDIDSELDFTFVEFLMNRET